MNNGTIGRNLDVLTKPGACSRSVIQPEKWHGPGTAQSVYEDLATVYHLMFPDWKDLVQRQAGTIAKIIKRKIGSHCALRILDPTCGIGTQALGLAERGHIVTGCDISGAAVDRARREASERNLDIRLEVADVRQLTAVQEDDFDVAVSFGNSLCTLSSFPELVLALTQIRMKLRAGGLIVAGIRDYSVAVHERPVRVDELMLCFDDGKWRIVHQVWHWINATHYIAHVYINREGESHQYSVLCRAVLRGELTKALWAAGFVNINWLPKDPTNRRPGVYESGFDQLIVVGERPAACCRPVPHGENRQES